MTATPAMDTAVLRKARGAFFTPSAVCDLATRWAVRSPDDSVMEPSCGEAAFLLSADRRLRELGASRSTLTGFELHEDSARRAREFVTSVGSDAQIHVGDFLAVEPTTRFDVVVGNPPFIRYQGFTGESREAAARAAAAQGVHLTNLASSWASFVVHASAFLRSHGRLALVLPAELLSSNYAAEVRTFLLRRFSRLRVVLFDSNVFPGVQTEALLLLAEGDGGTDVVEFARVATVPVPEELDFKYALRPSAGSKWTSALVATSATEALTELGSRSSFSALQDWGRISLGAVTGNNRWFALSRERVQTLGLAPTDLRRISPPGSTHLRTGSLTRADWNRLDVAGARTLLFAPRNDPSQAGWEYIAQGERDGVDTAFKCRVRPQWWRVALPSPPDLFVTCMNSHTPQLAANPERLRFLNSVHGLYLLDEHRSYAAVLAVACLNSATMLSAETVGRSYGGGILKLEPREAARLSVPSRALVESVSSELQSLVPGVRRKLAAGLLSEAVTTVDQVLFGAASVDPQQVAEMRRARNLLAHRRHSRARVSEDKASS